MTTSSPSSPHDHAPNHQRIDLLHGEDVAFWCRVFGTSITELRQAVQQVGPLAEQVRRYIAAHPPAVS